MGTEVASTQLLPLTEGQSDASDQKNSAPPPTETHNESAQSPLSSPLPSSSPRQSIGSNSNEAALTNFQKYGSIRPPISVLQDEFLETYRLWKEHNDALKGLESIRSKESSRDAWDGHMESIRALYTKHHREGAVLMGSPGSSKLNCEIRDMFQQAEQTLEEVQDIDLEEHGSNESISHDEEWRQMRHLADVLFSPGSKFIGAIQLPTTSSSRFGHASQSMINKDLKSYELVVMEADGLDEIGKQKGILCRHKIRGDEQCTYLKVNIVKLVDVEEEANLTKKSDVLSLSGKVDDTTSSNDGEYIESKKTAITQIEAGPSDASDIAAAPKFTIHIEYSDGEIHCQGYWDYKTSRFNGTVQIVSAERTETNPMGGTIISGLIGGRSGGSIENEGVHAVDRRRLSIEHTSQLHSILLSPCTNNHPRGINPVPLHTLAEYIELQDLTTSSIAKKSDHVSFMHEVLSNDNLIVILHRARSAAIRREALIKLVELGGYVDFSELARKRNVAQRREKWRNAISRFKPKFPQRFRRMRSKSSHSDDGPRVEKKKVQFHDHLAAISWTDLLEESGIESEKICAIFRRRVALLNSLTFPSDEYKAQTMSNIRSHGLSLLNSHAEWDQCIQMGRTIALGWSWFERGSWGCFERSAVVGRRCVHILFQMHSRLEFNHDRLEKAYRRADGRLTAEQLDRITISNPNTDKSEHLCGVCHCDVNELEDGVVDETDKPMYLLCSHGFHCGCIREWLHNNSSCPVCRLDFNVSLRDDLTY